MDVLISVAATPPHPSNVLALVQNLVLDAYGGGVVSTPDAVQLMQSHLQADHASTRAALGALAEGLAALRPNGAGVGLAFAAFSEPLTRQLLAEDGEVPTIVRQFLAVVFDAVRNVIDHGDIATAGRIAMYGADLALVIPRYARLTNIATDAADEPILALARDIVRTRTRAALIAGTGDEVATIFAQAVGDGLTLAEAVGVFEATLDEP